MKVIASIFILLGVVALADDQLRDAQAQLKTEGFFYGEIDGKDGAETTAALRRFQIRNGLAVTGKLNAETLAALGLTLSPATPAQPPRTTERKPPSQLNPPPPGAREPAEPADAPAPRPTRDLLRKPSVEDEEAADVRPPRAYLRDPAAVSPPIPVPRPVEDEFTTFYHGTPYATAPHEVQLDVLRKAQGRLARQGLYRGGADGFPGPATAEALFVYQEQRRLNRTGRLDLQTLGALELLPGRGPDAPPLRPFRDPGRGRDPSVDYRGITR